MASDWTGQADANAFADFFSQDIPNDYFPPWDDDALYNPASRDLSPLLLPTDDTVLPDLNSLSHTHPGPVNTSNAVDDPFPDWMSLDQDSAIHTFDQYAFDLEWQRQHKDHFPEQPTAITTDLEDAVAETATPARIAAGVDDAKAYGTLSKIRGSKRKTMPSSADAIGPKRARISSCMRAILDAHFNSSPYPKEGELTSLSGKTGLAAQVIKNWFANARSRKSGPQSPGSNNREKSAVISEESFEHRDQERPSTAQRLTDDSLRDAERLSPAPSVTSLERYLAAPTCQEAITPATIQATLRRSPITTLLSHKSVRSSRDSGSTGIISNEPLDRNLSTPVAARFGGLMRAENADTSAQVGWRKSPMQAYSVKGSDSSVGSNASFRSSGSHISVDSRGARQGRTRWKRAKSPTPRISVSVSSSTKIDPYFCTWPDCDKRFPNKSAWTRHEEAIHYQPYHWICCLESEVIVRLPHCPVCGEQDVLISHLVDSHFHNCAQRPQEDRTFMRQDQLSQHISGVHLKAKTTNGFMSRILSAWKKSNPLLSEASLHCGFCGWTFDTWTERQNHVSEHLASQICKSSWWPGRLRWPNKWQTTTEWVSEVENHYKCAACGKTFRDYADASRYHRSCFTKSCRYLPGWHAIFKSLAFDPDFHAQCKLCDYMVGTPFEGQLMTERLEAMRTHAESHNLRMCTQEIYTSRAEFFAHMRLEHGFSNGYMNLSSWSFLRKLICHDSRGFSVRVSGPRNTFLEVA